MRNRKRFLIFLVLTLLWMGFIFYKSGEPYQQQDLRPTLSAALPMESIALLLPRFEFWYDQTFVTYKEPLKMLEFFIRKGAHVAEYALLAGLIWGTLHSTTLPFAPAWWLTFAVTVLYAASDEWHQSFVPNRTGHAIDVYTFDTLGALLMLLIPLLRHFGRRRRPPRAR